MTLRICCHPVGSIEFDPESRRLYCKSCTGAVSAPLEHPMTVGQFPGWITDQMILMPDQEAAAQVDRLFGAIEAHLVAGRGSEPSGSR